MLKIDLSGWKVLIVEDDPDSLLVAQWLLELCGATVFSATNGQQGLASVTQQRPHFIITDLSMPIMSGWDMLDALKQDRKTMDIPVIALTAHAMVGDRNRAIAAGFHNFINKPLQPETFVNQLLKILMDLPNQTVDLPDLSKYRAQSVS